MWYQDKSIVSDTSSQPLLPFDSDTNGNLYVASASKLVMDAYTGLSPRQGPQSIKPISVNVEAGYLQGSYKLWSFSSDCLVGIKDGLIKQDFTLSTSIEGYLSFEFILSGGFDQQLGEHYLSNTNMPRAYMAGHGLGGRQVRFHKAGESIRSIGLWVSPELLFKHFNLKPGGLPSFVKSIVFLEKNNVAMLPLTAKMQSIITDIVDMPFTGTMSEHFLKAKITELLCYTVYNLNAADEAFMQDNLLSFRKSQAIASVLKVLSQQFASPPSLDELAQTACMSRSNLSNTFKSHYGIGISDYIHKRRMETAQTLLQEGKLAVISVALNVGYDDPSSFGRAYKRYFNHTPKSDLPKNKTAS